MSMKKMSVTLISCVLLAGTILAGCGDGNDGGGTGEASGKILRYNNSKEPTSLDPRSASTRFPTTW